MPRPTGNELDSTTRLSQEDWEALDEMFEVLESSAVEPIEEESELIFELAANEDSEEEPGCPA